ncbi:hypothetical protein Q2K19_26140 [Micromonospora soli]|uniref:hypothetical protein n=1 Tax=Micromonospora sp. NBRC 110009 TaxID=3061627 RepID=UPI002672E3C4|nr:hypothetical protein [Micromonospora sp. NBRC 110009]WKT97625.1 hypothetical protein Q2K19_26140 [Micromonospora sp. NBRC 110009]
MRAADEFSGVGRASDGGSFADPEDGGQVQRVGAGGDGFLELPVDAQSFEGAGQAAQVQDRARLARGEEPDESPRASGVANALWR